MATLPLPRSSSIRFQRFCQPPLDCTPCAICHCRPSFRARDSKTRPLHKPWPDVFMMNIIAKCPKCGAGLPVNAADAAETIKCGGCGREMTLTITEAMRTDTGVDRCPVCAGGDFYIRKDFDPKL